MRQRACLKCAQLTCPPDPAHIISPGAPISVLDVLSSRSTWMSACASRYCMTSLGVISIVSKSGEWQWFTGMTDRVSDWQIAISRSRSDIEALSNVLCTRICEHLRYVISGIDHTAEYVQQLGSCTVSSIVFLSGNHIPGVITWQWLLETPHRKHIQILQRPSASPAVGSILHAEHASVCESEALPCHTDVRMSSHWPSKTTLLLRSDF